MAQTKCLGFLRRALLLCGIATLPTWQGTAMANEDARSASKIERRWQQVGIASWYGREHHGKPTASGVPYDMHALTAAHPFLALGTIVRVENLAMRLSVTVRITDRGPYARGRIIDLSMAAAERIGIKAGGTGLVALSVEPRQYEQSDRSAAAGRIAVAAASAARF